MSVSGNCPKDTRNAPRPTVAGIELVDIWNRAGERPVVAAHVARGRQAIPLGEPTGYLESDGWWTGRTWDGELGNGFLKAGSKHHCRPVRANFVHADFLPKGQCFRIVDRPYIYQDSTRMSPCDGLSAHGGMFYVDPWNMMSLRNGKNIGGFSKQGQGDFGTMSSDSEERLQIE